MVRCGSNLPPIRFAHEDEQRIGEYVDAGLIGGVLLFNGVWPETAEALARLKARSAWPLLVASDLERGAGQQMRGLSIFPHARGVAAANNPLKAVAELATSTAREALAAGIDIAFAPVADVNTDPRNPIIAIRAFADEPERAAELVEAYVRAGEAAGLRTTAKHFPGHGDTHQDSHESLPKVEQSAATLRERELVPFRAAISAGVSLIMTAHVAYPALDPTGTPATLSAPILTTLLREELGFTGVCCSDSLLMAGVRDLFADEGALAVATLKAGVDLLLDIADPLLAITAIERAVETGELSLARVDEAFARVEALARNSHAEYNAALDATPGRAAAEQIAREAVSIVPKSSGDEKLLGSNEKLLAVLFKPFHLPSDPVEQPFASAVRELGPQVEYIEFGPELHAHQRARLDKLVASADRVVVAMIVKPAAWHAFGLAPEQRALVQHLIAQKPTLVASLGVAKALEEFPNATAWVSVHSDVAASQRALAAALRSLAS